MFQKIIGWSFKLDSDIREYKGFHTFEKVLIPFLEQKAKEQEERGLDYSKEPTNWPF